MEQLLILASNQCSPTGDDDPDNLVLQSDENLLHFVDSKQLIFIFSRFKEFKRLEKNFRLTVREDQHHHQKRSRLITNKAKYDNYS